MGIVSITDAKRIPRPPGRRRRWDEFMRPAPLKSVAAAADLSVALELLAEHTLHQAPVLDGDKLVGIVTRADILRVLQYRDEVGLRGGQQQEGAKGSG